MSVPGSDQPMKKSTKKAAPKRKSVMKGGRIDKAMLPSRHVTEGPERAPHRSFYYAMGLTEKEIHQPFVGVATTRSEEHTSELQSLMRISYDGVRLQKNKKNNTK